MLDLINLLALNNMEQLCDELAPIIRLVGIVIKVIWILVPVVLIIYGMLDFFKAVTEKDDDAIKKAEKKLMNRGIAALIVFFVIPIVGILMNLISADDYKVCMECIEHPFSDSCPATFDE